MELNKISLEQEIMELGCVETKSEKHFPWAT